MAIALLKPSWRVLFLLMLLVTRVGAGAQPVVTLSRDGAAADGEVCRFSARDAENPFRRWLASQEVTCVPAGSSMAIPPGKWNIFGRSGDKAISRETLLVDGDASPPELSLTLAPSGTLIPLLPDGVSAAVYVPRRGRVVPIPAGSPRIAVPAEEELWLFLVEKSLPVAIFPVAAIETGGERMIDARGSRNPYLIGWVRVPERDRSVLDDARGVSGPTVGLRAGGRVHDSYPLPPLTLLNGAFFLIGGVTAGDGHLEIGGRGWLPHRRPLRVEPALVTVSEDPLLARPAATLLVSWTAPDNLVALDQALGSCTPQASAHEVVINIAACGPPERPGGPVDPASCQPFMQKSSPAEFPTGSFAVDDLPPGHYRGELRFGKLPPTSAVAEAAGLRQTELRIRAMYIPLSGSLTRAGESLPEDTSISFPDGGVGFSGMETGEYQAVLGDAMSTDDQIEIAACDGEPRAVVLVDRPPRLFDRFDIDIPDNSITVSVTDTFTRIPLDGATVRYVVMSRLVPRRPVITRDLKTPADGDAPAGRVVIEPVPEREIHLTVTRAGYEKYRVAPFTMSKSEEREVDVQLVPLRGTTGRIISSRPFDNGTLLWISSAGRETERADIAADGTFIFVEQHQPDETLAVVSLSHPLWVFRHRPSEPGERLQLRFPDAPARDFEVRIPSAHELEVRYIGVLVGGVILPQAALRLHQSLRNLSSTIRGTGPLPIRGIAEVGPIEVLPGPTLSEYPARIPTDPMFRLPYATAPRVRLSPGATEVVLEPK